MKGRLTILNELKEQRLTYINKHIYCNKKNFMHVQFDFLLQKICDLQLEINRLKEKRI